MGKVIHVDFVERKRRKTVEEIYDEAEREMHLLRDMIHCGHGDPVPDDFIMPLPDDGLDHD